MPTILIHELIGYKFAKKHKEYDNKNFYLGLMVPDAVNAYGFASKDERWKAHYRDSDLNKWKENILFFYKENTKKIEASYLIGYFVHVLTDIICDKIYKEDLYPNLVDNGYNYDSAYEYYRKQIEKYENSNLNSPWWEYVKSQIQQGEKIPINNISIQMIEDWIKYTLQKYEKRNFEETEYITDDFAKKVLNEIEKTISEIEL